MKRPYTKIKGSDRVKLEVYRRELGKDRRYLVFTIYARPEQIDPYLSLDGGLFRDTFLAHLDFYRESGGHGVRVPMDGVRVVKAKLQIQNIEPPEAVNSPEEMLARLKIESRRYKRRPGKVLGFAGWPVATKKHELK